MYVQQILHIFYYLLVYFKASVVTLCECMLRKAGSKGLPRRLNRISLSHTFILSHTLTHTLTLIAHLYLCTGAFFSLLVIFSLTSPPAEFGEISHAVLYHQVYTRLLGNRSIDALLGIHLVFGIILVVDVHNRALYLL